MFEGSIQILDRKHRPRSSCSSSTKLLSTGDNFPIGWNPGGLDVSTRGYLDEIWNRYRVEMTERLPTR